MDSHGLRIQFESKSQWSLDLKSHWRAFYWDTMEQNFLVWCENSTFQILSLFCFSVSAFSMKGTGCLKKNSVESIWRSNWLYSMIHESRGIPSDKVKKSSKELNQLGGFYKHTGWGERKSRFPYFLWGMEKWASYQWITYFCCPGKSRWTGIRLQTWEEQKLQEGWDLSLGLLTWGLVQVTPFGVCCLYFLTRWNYNILSF